MAENLQDEILEFEDCNEYDISYPVIVTRWEIKQVHGLNKQYLQVYFQKLDNTVKAFQMNIACYSAFGKEVEKLSDISIQEVDKKSVEFSEVIPLNVDTRRVKIFVTQCLLVDGTIIEKHERQMVVNTFKPFAEEDKAAAQRLLLNAKGYPIDNVSHWFCACGAIHYKSSNACERCSKSKEEIFSLITPDRLQEENFKVTEIERYNNKKNKTKKLVLACIALGALILTLISFCFYVIVDGHNRIYGVWIPLNKTLFILLILISIGLLGTNILGWFLIKDKLLKKIQMVTIITCFVINSINSGIGFAIGYDFAAYYVPLILNIPCTVAYFICSKVLSKE